MRCCRQINIANGRSRSQFHPAGFYQCVLTARAEALPDDGQVRPANIAAVNAGMQNRLRQRATRRPVVERRLRYGAIKDGRGMSRMTLKLVIGNKNYSSWSMRPWLALRANNIAFEEVFIPLYTGDGRQAADSRASRPRARYRRWWTAMSRCGIRLRSSNISPSDFRKRGCGPKIAPAALMRVRSRRRCIRALWRCATNAA